VENVDVTARPSVGHTEVAGPQSRRTREGVGVAGVRQEQEATLGLGRKTFGQPVSGARTRRRKREIAVMFQFLGLIVVGLIIGALARLLKPGRQRLSLLATLALGVVGAIIGGSLADLLGVGSIFELNILGFIFAVIAAVMLVGVAERMSSRSRATRH
jgi:uncharacterized membrane protein YeaQ/YmgE (transglycosylase-associated protein family)